MRASHWCKVYVGAGLWWCGFFECIFYMPKISGCRLHRALSFIANLKTHTHRCCLDAQVGFFWFTSIAKVRDPWAKFWGLASADCPWSPHWAGERACYALCNTHMECCSSICLVAATHTELLNDWWASALSVNSQHAQQRAPTCATALLHWTSPERYCSHFENVSSYFAGLMLLERIIKTLWELFTDNCFRGNACMEGLKSKGSSSGERECAQKWKGKMPIRFHLLQVLSESFAVRFLCRCQHKGWM